MSDTEAPEGTVYVCAACGRSAKDYMNFSDTACVVNSILCYEDKEDDKWIPVNSD